MSSVDMPQHIFKKVCKGLNWLVSYLNACQSKVRHFLKEKKNPDSQNHYIHYTYYLIKNDETYKEAGNYS